MRFNGKWFESVVLLVFCMTPTARADRTVPTALSEQSAACITCHESGMPGLVREWRHSRHYGADIGCYECHVADAKDLDAVDHNGYTISVVVSPKDCAKCHVNEFNEFEASHHAAAGTILGSLDNMLAK